MRYIKTLCNWFLSFIVTKTYDMDKIVEMLDFNNFYGEVGNEIHYFDNLLNTYIFTIIVKKNNIRIIPTSLKPDYINKLNILNLGKSQRIVLYQKIEEYMVSIREQEENKLKRQLLYGIGLTEGQFKFLVDNCKDN